MCTEIKLGSHNFIRQYQALSDAYDGGLMDGDTYDLILSTMSEIYASEARAIAIAAGEINADDLVVPDANLEDLFAAVEQKEQFTHDFINAIKLAPKISSADDFVSLIREMR